MENQLLSIGEKGNMPNLSIFSFCGITEKQIEEIPKLKTQLDEIKNLQDLEKFLKKFNEEF